MSALFASRSSRVLPFVVPIDFAANGPRGGANASTAFLDPPGSPGPDWVARAFAAVVIRPLSYRPPKAPHQL